MHVRLRRRHLSIPFTGSGALAYWSRFRTEYKQPFNPFYGFWFVLFQVYGFYPFAEAFNPFYGFWLCRFTPREPCWWVYFQSLLRVLGSGAFLKLMEAFLTTFNPFYGFWLTDYGCRLDVFVAPFQSLLRVLDVVSGHADDVSYASLSIPFTGSGNNKTTQGRHPHRNLSIPFTGSGQYLRIPR